MNVVDCLTDVQTDFLNCISMNQEKSICRCNKNIIKENSQFSLKNNDLYENLYANEIIDVSRQEKWYNSSLKRISDCLDDDINEFNWQCLTFSHNLEETICKCYHKNNDHQFDQYGFIRTRILYRGIKKIKFPMKNYANISYATSAVLDISTTQIKFFNSDFIDEQKTHDETVSLLVFFACLLFICFLCILKNSIYRRRIRKKDEDSISITFLGEIETEI